MSTVELAILVVCCANTVVLILLLIFYCIQIKQLKKRMTGLCIREPAIYRSPSGTQLNIPHRSNSLSTKTHPNIPKPFAVPRAPLVSSMVNTGN